MWKLKMASKLAGGPDIPNFGGENAVPKKWSIFARYAAGIAAIALFILGFLASILVTIWVGVICLFLVIPVGILEYPYVPLEFLVKAVNFFQDYRYRIGFYVIICIPTFFSIPTLFAGLILLVVAGLYGFAYYLGERGEEVKQTDWTGEPKPEVTHQHPPKSTASKEMHETKNTKDSKKKKGGLASQDALAENV